MKNNGSYLFFTSNSALQTFCNLSVVKASLSKYSFLEHPQMLCFFHTMIPIHSALLQISVITKASHP